MSLRDDVKKNTEDVRTALDVAAIAVATTGAILGHLVKKELMTEEEFEGIVSRSGLNGQKARAFMAALQEMREGRHGSC